MIHEETFTCNYKICDTYGALDALLSLPYKSSKILLRPYDFSFYCWIIAEQVSVAVHCDNNIYIVNCPESFEEMTLICIYIQLSMYLQAK